MQFNGYRRPDGSVGIRNRLLVIAVDECCEGVARQIAAPFRPDAVVLTNWYTCMLGGNEATFHQMAAVAENPNVAGVLVLAMGCGSIAPRQLADPVAGRTGKPVATLTVEAEGGTRRAISRGRAVLEELAGRVHGQKPEPFPVDRLVVGVKCGGSDTSSGMASNPACGAAVDRLIDLGATCIGGELFELQGCEDTLAARAVSPGVGDRIRQLIDDERARWCVEGVEVETMSVGNYVGGLTTIEEKSLGALHKIGSRPIRDILEITERGVDRPGPPGLYLSEATMLCGGAGVNFAAMGAHMLLWTTGSAGFESPLTPVLRISGNRQIMTDDIDIDASGIMDGTRGVSQVAEDILRALLETAGGKKTAIEDLGGSSLTLYQKKAKTHRRFASGANASICTTGRGVTGGKFAEGHRPNHTSVKVKSARVGRKVSFPRRMSLEMTDLILFPPRPSGAETLRGIGKGRLFGRRPFCTDKYLHVAEGNSTTVHC